MHGDKYKTILVSFQNNLDGDSQLSDMSLYVNSCTEFEDSNWNVDRTYNSLLKFSYTKVKKIYHQKHHHNKKNHIICANIFTIFLRHSFTSCLYLAVVPSSHVCLCFLFTGVVFWVLIPNEISFLWNG